MPFLSFKGTTHAYLLKILMTHYKDLNPLHNKNLNPLLNLLTDCMSAKSAPQILSLNPQ